MTITRTLLRIKFRELNQKYFEHKLLTPKFSTFYSSGHSIGLCFYNKDSRKMKICIARNAVFNEDAFDNVMIHEMIHLYLFQTVGHWRGRRHGRDFHRVAKNFKSRYGIVIPDIYPNIEITTINQEKDVGIFKRVIKFLSKLKAASILPLF